MADMLHLFLKKKKLTVAASSPNLNEDTWTVLLYRTPQIPHIVVSRLLVADQKALRRLFSASLLKHSAGIHRLPRVKSSQLNIIVQASEKQIK